MEPIILLLIIVLFFVPTILMMRKQRKQQEEIRNLQNALEVGDRVVTAGGLFGTVVTASETRVYLEIAPDVVVQWDRAGILRREEPVAAAPAEELSEEGALPAGEAAPVEPEAGGEDERPSR